MKIHLSGVCGTAMASLAGPPEGARARGHGLRPGRLPADVHAARGPGHRGPLALRRGERPRGRRPRGDRQRALARQPRGGDRARPQAAHDEPARAPGRGVHSRPHLARGGGHPRQDHDHEPPGLPPGAGRAGAVVPRRRRARRLRPELSASAGAPHSSSKATSTTAPSSTSGRSSSTTCPTSPSSATSSSTTPTSTPTSPPCRRPSAGSWASCRGAACSIAGVESPALGRSCRGAPVRWRPSRSRPGATGARVDVRHRPRGHALPAGASRRATRASSRWRSPASTTCATRSRPWPRPPRLGVSPEAARPLLPRSAGVKRRLELRGRCGASPSTTTSPTIPRRSARP